MAETALQRLARFAAETHAQGPPAWVQSVVAERILDTLGVGLAGARRPAVKAVRSALTGDGGEPQATVWVSGERLPAATAALVNGTMSHALDFDDTHLPSVLHPSASVVPAALATAELCGASGSDLITAVAVGNEITCRLGMAAYDPGLRNSVFFEHGFHATSICGTIGSAAAAAILLQGEAKTVGHAMAIAASMGAGLLEANRTGGTVKPVHAGWAAHSGITAARLAVAGLTGPATVIEGRFGFLRAYAGEQWDLDQLIGGLGDRWEVERLFTKPYPTNHFTHAGIDAARALRADGVDPAEVVSIELGAAAPTLRTIAEPPEEKARPQSGYHAKFSGPFTVATALLGGGGLGVAEDDFTDSAVSDGERLRLASLVRCIVDEEATESFPHQFGGVLRVRLGDGSVREHRVRHTRGGPENPLSPDELALKFRLNAEPVVGAEAASAMIEQVNALSALESVKPIVQQLAPGSLM